MDFAKIKNLGIAFVACLVLATMAAAVIGTTRVDVVEESATPPAANGALESAPTKPPHPVSLPAYFGKTFDGRDFTVGRVLADNEAYTRYYITYKSAELTISGIMNVPKGEGPFPLLVLNHGHIDTSIYTNGRGLKREQDYLARHGYVVVHPDYRGHAESDDDPEEDYRFRLGYTEDVVNAVLAVRAAKLPYIDTERIGMLGHSMGGGITQNVIVIAPDLVSAAVLYAPVSMSAHDSYERWSSRSPVGAEVIRRYGSLEDSPEFWKNISAANFADRINVPVAIFHGTADDSVPLEWSERTLSILKEAGKDAELHIYQNEPHEFAREWGAFMESTVEFFDKQLSGRPG